MTLILKSFVQSFSVFARMILPMIVIFLGSILFWGVANMVTLGYASYVSSQITAAFIALVGIRVALSINGDDRRTDTKFLLLYAAVYGIVLMVAKAALVIMVNLIAVLTTDWNLSDIGSLRTFVDAESAVQTTFVLHLLSFKALFSVIFLAAVPAAMAIPMAAAAQAAGLGALEKSYFWGFGRYFVPLYLVCLITYVPQFVFGIIGALYTFFALLIAFSAILTGSFEFTSVQILLLLKGLLAVAALLWLNSWVWAASALAFLNAQDSVPKKVETTPQEPEIAPVDLRELRKQRSSV